MKQPNISFLLQIKPTKSTRQIEFNQQSTNNLLSQLKLSLQDVETIINKSKEALGLASSLEISLSQVQQVRGRGQDRQDRQDAGGERVERMDTKDRMDRKGGRQDEDDHGQSICFNVSGDVSKESTIRDQLTYSVSLGTFSRVKLEDTETMNIRTSRNILRKLDFGYTQSRIQTATISQKQQQISPPKPQPQPQYPPPDPNPIKIQPTPIQLAQLQQKSPQTTNRLQQTPTTNKIRQQSSIEQKQKTTNKKQNLSSLHLSGQKQNQQLFQLEIMDADHTHGVLVFSKMEDMASKFQPYTRDWQFNGEDSETMQFQSLDRLYGGNQKNNEQNCKFESPKSRQKQESRLIANLKQKHKQAYSTQQSTSITTQSGKWNKYSNEKKAELTSKHTNRYLSSIQEQPDITIKKPEKSPQRIAPRSQRIKIFKQRVMNFNKSTLPTTTTTANHAKTSINVYTHTHSDHYRHFTHVNGNQSKGRVSMEDGEMDNTCARNQLQNILMLNYASRKTKNNQRFESSLNSGDLFATTQQRQDHKKNFQGLTINVPQKTISQQQRKSKSKSVSKSKSPSRSPSRSPAQQKQPQKSTVQHSPIKRPQYIQKYMQNMQRSPISPNQKHTPHPHSHSQKNNNESPSKLKYSHVKKSPQNKKPIVFQIQEHLSQKQKVCTREDFIDKMLQQCYVRRFLSKNQLWRIYDEFCGKKVPRYLWEQKVIEKIFKKIHEIDEIM